MSRFISNSPEKPAPAARKVALPVAAGLMLLLSACTARVSEHGYVYDQRDLDRLQPGVTTQSQVETLMGTPSSSSVIEGEAWFYIASTTETVAFYPPEEVQRKVVAIHFNDNKVVDEVAYLGLEDGQVIDFVQRKTRSRGKELTVLQQLFGNLGKFNNAGGAGGGALPSSGAPGDRR